MNHPTMPTRQGLRWFMVGLGIVILLFCSVSSVVLLLDHNSDLGTISNQQGQILSLQKQAHTLGLQNRTSLKDYLAEQKTLTEAGKVQVAFALYLAETNKIICDGLHLSCTVPPPIPSS